jgi:organic hydroperoxide reductase OsmC/OhrA
MTGKTKPQLFFETELNWLGEKKGIVTAADVKDTLRVATPPGFGGDAGMWSPEHLFLASLSSCFMTTYLAIAGKMRLPLSHFECNAIGQVAVVEGVYRFTNINLYPKIYITDAMLTEQAEVALLKAKKHCLVSNSVNATIIHHGQVIVETARVKLSPATDET